MPERLHKLLAKGGVSSRRAAEKLITEGRVTVNGQTVRELGTKADASDKIVVDGQEVYFDAERIVLMLNKPPKIMVTMHDPEGRATVVDFLHNKPFMGMGPAHLPRVFPVGRLDYDAQGLLIFTNDGGLAERLIHPRYHVPKTYLVKVSDILEERNLVRIRKGIMLKENDGTLRRSLPAEVQMHRKAERHGWYEITVMEGRNHLIKRLFAAVGHPVRRILRITFGGLPLGNLPEGQWRALEDHEIEKLEGWLDKKAEIPRSEFKPVKKSRAAFGKAGENRGTFDARRHGAAQATGGAKNEKERSGVTKSRRGASDNGIGKSTKTEGRSGQGPRQRAGRQGARNLRQGPRR